MDIGDERVNKMIKKALLAGLAVAALLPGMAQAQISCEQQQSSRTAGTLAGAGIGALLGSAVAGRNDRTAGAIIGGIGGAVIGNQIAKSSANCQRAYGFYDNDRVWHASPASSQPATGYYDRSGDWVEGAPSGYYSNEGTWIRAEREPEATTYRNSTGNWVPAAETGYYDARGVWVEGSASGFYDTQGRWHAGPVTGQYNSRGVWVSGASTGHRDQNGRWVADPAPGYYANDGRWYPGTANGYYDNRGRWTSTSGSNGNYQPADVETDWRGAPQAPRARSLWLTQKVQQGQRQGHLRQANAQKVLRDLIAFRRQEMQLRHYNGNLGRQDQARMLDRLNTISLGLNWSR